ncbi:MAG: hypothetical protein ACJ741_10145 [Pyrinomonadaceae bacterium]
MKHPIMICARRRFPWQVRLIFLPAAIFFFALSAHAQADVKLPAIGGGGGSEFVARCPDGELLVGLYLRDGDWVNAISPVCDADYGLFLVGPGADYPYQHFGGEEGRISQLSCSDHRDILDATYFDLLGNRTNLALSLSPIVLGMYVGSEGKHTVTVNRLHLICGIADPDKIGARDLSKYVFGGSAEIDAAIKAQLRANQIRPPTVSFDGITRYPGPVGEQRCPDGLVAVGIHGRSGEWLDAVGLICGAPKITPVPSAKSTPPPIALGRVQSTTPQGPPMSICERAQDARARNSPAAPSLEAQCRAARDKLPPVALGRVQGTQPGTSMSICERAQDARARNSPAAPNLEAQCRAYLKSHPPADGNAPPAPAAVGPTITAGANPVMVPNGQVSGTTTITWKAAPDYNYCEIYLSVDDGEWSEFARGGDSSKPVTVKRGSSYTFRMMVYEGQEGTPKIITTLTVTAKN